MNPALFDGVYPAIVTPLTADGKVAIAVAEKLLTHLIAAGVDGVYAAGSTGEGKLLSLESREALAECLMRALPQNKKLLVHVGAGNAKEAIRLAEHAAKIGAHAVSSLPPQGDSATVREYYIALARHSPLPLIVYYFPDACPGAFPRPQDLIDLCSLIQVAAIKFTDFNLYLMSQLSDGGMLMYNGRDEIFAAGMLMGARGGIGSTYNLAPELYLAIYRHAQKGEWAEARSLQRIANRFITVLLKYPLLPALKAGLASMGFECGPTAKGDAFRNDAERQQFLTEIKSVLPEPGSIRV